MSQDFFDQLSEPVQQLFFMGEQAARSRPWPDYLALGIRAELILELIRIVRHFQSICFDDDLAFTPLHAWRALGQLQAQEANDPLIFLAHKNEEHDIDWVGEEIPQVLSMIGPQSETEQQPKNPRKNGAAKAANVNDWGDLLFITPNTV